MWSPEVFRAATWARRIYRVPTHVCETGRFLLWTGCCRFQVEDRATHWHPPIPRAICGEYGCDGDRWSRAFHSCRSYGSLSKVRCSLATGPLITPNTNLKTSNDVTNGLCPQCLSLSYFCPSISVFLYILPLFLFVSFLPVVCALFGVSSPVRSELTPNSAPHTHTPIWT